MLIRLNVTLIWLKVLRKQSYKNLNSDVPARTNGRMPSLFEAPSAAQGPLKIDVCVNDMLMLVISLAHNWQISVHIEQVLLKSHE